MACNEYRLEDSVFHTQATPTFHLEKHFRTEAMAYEPILLATLEYKPRRYLPGTCGFCTKPTESEVTK